jgi:hypothetical protein
MTYVINNHGGDAPPYGPSEIVFEDDMFLTDADAAAFMEGFRGLIDAHTPSVNPNYVMRHEIVTNDQIFPPA